MVLRSLVDLDAKLFSHFSVGKQIANDQLPVSQNS